MRFRATGKGTAAGFEGHLYSPEVREKRENKENDGTHDNVWVVVVKEMGDAL